MTGLTLRFLGPPRVELDGEPVHIGRRKALALLAYVAVTGRPHARDTLATLLWPQYDQSSARAELRRTLSVLRRALGEGWLEADRERVGLGPDAGVLVDVARFRDSLATCEGHGHGVGEACDACGRLLEAAAGLYEGDFLAGFTLPDAPSFDEWQLFETEGLRDELGSVLERLAAWEGAQGAHEAAIGHARRWVALDPLHEPAQRGLMRAHEGAGQRSAALRQYRECERELQAGLGLPPSAQTTALYEHIRSGEMGPDQGLPPAPAPERRHNLPAQPIPLVGREREIDAICECLQDPNCRLLTLVGPGGSGKTRLAIEAAVRLIESFEDGVWFAPLAGVESSEGVAPAIAQVIGFQFYGQGEPEAQLAAYLGNKHMLIIVDNLEHLLRSGAVSGDRASKLLVSAVEAAPDLKLLATSRAALHVQHEHLFPVRGMAYPGGDDSAADAAGGHSAVELFVQAARRVDPEFGLSGENLPGVVGICRAVAGMPLGILLAAAWVRVLSAVEIAAQIRSDLDLLEAELSDVPARQRSMRAVFDHSWSLLTERESGIMGALSVFRGGFTREAGREVAGASLRDLRSLVDRSLVQPAEGGRYQLHELLRQYAEAYLARTPDAWDAARGRHAAYYATALEAWEADIRTPREQSALRQMDFAIDNVRAAWDWALQRSDVEHLSQAADGLADYLERRALHCDAEVTFRGGAEQLRARGEAMPRVGGVAAVALVKMLHHQGAFEYRLGRDGLGSGALEEGLEILRNSAFDGEDLHAREAALLFWLGMAEQGLGRSGFRETLEHSLRLARPTSDRSLVGAVLSQLAGVHFLAGEIRQARNKHAESIAVHRAVGDQRGVAWSSMLFAGFLAVVGELEAAESLARDSVSAFRGLDDLDATANALSFLGEVLRWAGEYEESQLLVEESVALLADTGIPTEGLWTLLAWAEIEQGQYERARDHLFPGLKGNEEEHRHFRFELLGKLEMAAGAWDAAKRACNQSTAGLEAGGWPEQAAHSRCVLAYAHMGLGKTAEARRCIASGLRRSRDVGSLPVLIEVMPAAALLLLKQGEAERGVEIYALACTLPAVANSVWFDDVVGKPIAEAAASLPPDVVTAAQGRGRAREMKATLDELIAEWGD